MKKFLIATVAIASTIASAEDAPQPVTAQIKTDSSLIYDLMYFPPVGTFFGESSLKYRNSKSELDFNTVEVYKNSSNETSVEQTMSYVFASSTMAGISLDYQIDGKTTTTYGVASTLNGMSAKSKSSTGLGEPSLFLKDRLKNQNDWSYNLDLGVSFSPKLGDAKTATTTAKGNGYRGASELSITAEIGRKEEAYQWKALVNYANIGKGKSKSGSDSSDINESDSHSVFSLGYVYQFNLRPEIELNLNAAVLFIGEQEIKNTHDATAVSIDSVTGVAVGPELIFNINPKMIVNLSYTFVSTEDVTVRELDTTTSTTLTLESKDNISHLLSLSAKYEF